MQAPGKYSHDNRDDHGINTIIADKVRKCLFRQTLVLLS